ncbi:hypothetical protein M0R45_011495 [Rubus argutus]|uniref:RNA-dependent RNA polymerase n=1 Tax=Rubus argutus TaxID=59490 RepID=A0AAW1YBA0_RUBAR
MANENLGAICNAHVVLSDRSEYGASDVDCKKLAKLAATAVDLPKTGNIVTMPPHLKPELYPDFMGKEDQVVQETRGAAGAAEAVLQCFEEEFRRCFEMMDRDYGSMSDDRKNVLYEQKASAWYIVTYHPRVMKESLDLQGPDGPGDVPMLSFAWIAADYLARIKIKHRGVGMMDYSRKPINSLRRYLADRIWTCI